jgi:hypothetical protein
MLLESHPRPAARLPVGKGGGGRTERSSGARSRQRRGFLPAERSPNGLGIGHNSLELWESCNEPKPGLDPVGQCTGCNGGVHWMQWRGALDARQGRTGCKAGAHWMQGTGALGAGHGCSGCNGWVHWTQGRGALDAWEPPPTLSTAGFQIPAAGKRTKPTQPLTHHTHE